MVFIIFMINFIDFVEKFRRFTPYVVVTLNKSLSYIRQAGGPYLVSPTAAIPNTWPGYGVIALDARHAIGSCFHLKTKQSAMAFAVMSNHNPLARSTGAASGRPGNSQVR